MGTGEFRGRPPILGLATAASFALSILNVLWVVLLGGVALLLGLGSFLLGPVVGAIGSALALVIVLVLLAESALSFLLFVAAWRTLNDRPSGVKLHKTWAWISLVFELGVLGLFQGLEPGAWVRLAYAAFLLYAMNMPDVAAYHARPPEDLYKKPGRPSDWL